MAQTHRLGWRSFRQWRSARGAPDQLAGQATQVLRRSRCSRSLGDGFGDIAEATRRGPPPALYPRCGQGMLDRIRQIGGGLPVLSRGSARGVHGSPIAPIVWVIVTGYSSMVGSLRCSPGKGSILRPSPSTGLSLSQARRSPASGVVAWCLRFGPRASPPTMAGLPLMGNQAHNTESHESHEKGCEASFASVGGNYIQINGVCSDTPHIPATLLDGLVCVALECAGWWR